MYIRISLVSFLLMCCLGGCATMNSEHQTTSSLVDFLYPAGQPHPLTEEVVNLKLPVKVGIVFVPSTSGTHLSGGPFPGVHSPIGMADQVALLDEVAGHFRKYPYIKTVEVIPDNYLTAGGGFANIDALAAMYDVDVVALVSYDQVQNTDEGALSLLYLTIVGAYTIPAEKNTTTTFVDTAVFDVKSRKLLFRAPGISRGQEHSTLVNNSEGLRDASRQGFQDAFQQMTTNLDTALTGFRQKVKDEPDTYKVSYAQGYHGGTGGGGTDGLGLLLCLSVLWLLRRRVLLG